MRVLCGFRGYPKEYEKGFEIFGLDEAEKDNNVVFHAGTKVENDKYINNRGRDYRSYCIRIT